MDHSQHNPNLTTEIWLPCMPQPQIPYNETSLFHNRLTRPPHPSPPLQPLLPNPPTGTLSMLTYLCLLPEHVRAQPDLCAPILDTHIHQWNVNDEGERRAGVSEIGIGMHRLRGRWGGGGGRHSAVPGDEGETRARAEDGGCYLGGERVEEDGGGEPPFQ